MNDQTANTFNEIFKDHDHVPGCGCPSHKQETYQRQEAKVGRNDACPCDSGKKYKKCCA